MEPIYWSVLLCVLMAIALFLELLTPSFGFFTLLAVGFLAASIWLGFKGSGSAGYVMAGVNFTVFPATLYLAMKLFKHSPLLHHQEIRAGVPTEPEKAKTVHALIGRQGEALTILRPAGTAQFGEQRLDVTTEGKYVEAGKPVKVIRVDGSIVVVEPLG